MQDGLPIGRLAERTGVKVETIRYYERIGIMPKPDRTQSGHRRYGPAHVARLRFIKRGRELGFPLKDVRSLLGLDDGPSSCAEVHEVAVCHLDSIRQRIEDLRALERTLAGAADACTLGDTPDCPVIDALSSKPAVGAWD